MFINVPNTFLDFLGLQPNKKTRKNHFTSEPADSNPVYPVMLAFPQGPVWCRDWLQGLESLGLAESPKASLYLLFGKLLPSYTFIFICKMMREIAPIP